MQDDVLSFMLVSGVCDALLLNQDGEFYNSTNKRIQKLRKLMGLGTLMKMELKISHFLLHLTAMFLAPTFLRASQDVVTQMKKILKISCRLLRLT